MNNSSRHPEPRHTDVAVIGAGIVGLAHALAAAKAGLRVRVFERNPQAVGASIRNFGMVWPIGQPLGQLYDRAMRSRQIWLEVAAGAGITASADGSLHLARYPDEVAVLEEFYTTVGRDSYQAQLLNPGQVVAKSLAVQTDGLKLALWSPTEVIVDPREAITKLPAWLEQQYGVQFNFRTAIAEIRPPYLIAGQQKWQADQIILCSGSDFETLYPEVYAKSGITKVKLQMMRTVAQPGGWRLGPALCGGLTLTHYGAFAHCQSLGALRDRIQALTPHFPQWGIHVMVSQNGLGELVIGDSHEYGWHQDPFDREDINQYILEYLHSLAEFPTWQISDRWHGIYAKIPGQTELIHQPETGVTIVNALGGAGMTLSFGLGEEVIQRGFS
jgi:FAD dependent oxidoreductase TIGR03364